jgi:hypothetical protein
MTLEIVRKNEEKMNLNRIAVSIENGVLQIIDPQRFKWIDSLEDKKVAEKERSNWIHDLRKQKELPGKEVILEYAKNIQDTNNPILMLDGIKRHAASLAPTIRTIRR